MPLYHFQTDLGMDQAGVEAARRQFGLSLPSVEAIAELVEVLLQIRGRYAMVGAQQKRLEIAGGDVHSGQPFVGLFRRRRARGMVLGGLPAPGS